jgi:hypothetical protein
MNQEYHISIQDMDIQSDFIEHLNLEALETDYALVCIPEVELFPAGPMDGDQFKDYCPSWRF